MARKEEEIKEEYRKHLDPKEFKEFKLKGLKDEQDENNYDFYFKCLYEFFSRGKCAVKYFLLFLLAPPQREIETWVAYLMG